MRKSVHSGDLPVADDAGSEPGRTAGPDPELAGFPHSPTAAVEPRGEPESAPPPLDLDDEASFNDARLVELARHGDHRAFEVLVRRYERKLVRVLARLIRDPETARDLAQETFWRVYSRLERFDTARRFGPWLFRVGVNLGLDWLRRARTESAAPASIDQSRGDGRFALELPDPDPRIRADLAQEVHHILSQLPVSYRTILVLRDLEGFSSSEVAAIVGRREATVRWRLSMARDKFREIWQRRHDEVRGEAKNG
ncbi:MAG: sigma-70 family RNA polymerase sigma factor [Isosphaeraceae bacterium]